MVLGKELLLDLLHFLDCYSVRAYVKVMNAKASLEDCLYYVIFETVEKINGEKLEFSWPDYFRANQWQSMKSYISEVTGITKFDVKEMNFDIPDNVIAFPKKE
jgi:hypothetical protein